MAVSSAVFACLRLEGSDIAEIAAPSPSRLWRGSCCNKSSARCRPARDYAFIAYRRVPSPTPSTTLAPIEDAFTSGRPGGSWCQWPGPLTGHVLAWEVPRSLSLQPPPLSLSPSRPSRTCVRVGTPATVSCPTRPARHAVSGGPRARS